MKKPLCIDLFCGLGGWSDGFLAEEYDVVGFDIERHDYGTGGYPAQLVLQDVLTLHGSQFRNAAIIVASPPCQFFSRMAMPFKMPWKQEEYERRRDLSLALFNSCFRIQREASEAAGRAVPLIVENVRGGQKWVGRAAWHFGSFYLWGDVPALMPPTKIIKHSKNNGGSWFAIGSPGQKVTGQNPDGRKVGGDWFGSYAEHKAAGTISPGRLYGKNSDSRKAASAQIAKIPFPLAQWIAKTYADPS